jgi:DNA-binding NarL/FixJ family response regulator
MVDGKVGLASVPTTVLMPVCFIRSSVTLPAQERDPPGRIPAEIAQQPAEHSADDAITPRELDVLRAIADGQSNKAIASDLNIAEHTVKNHVKSILSKFDANERTDAAMIALRRGYVEM